MAPSNGQNGHGMISVYQLTKTLGAQQVLRGVDLNVEAGQTCVD